MAFWLFWLLFYTPALIERVNDPVDGWIAPPDPARRNFDCEAITDEAFAASAAIDEKFLDELRKTMEVNEVDTPAFVAKAKGVQDAYIGEFGDDWIKLVDAARATN